ncbi:HD-GYP domain-containing protein [Ralstonia sp. UNC404CL21Col]|uniref:HD-GYP domain-containing protein n=1 Tax=Ralstonia sp. UNC404CL21Col TaxID=1380362 RepID=UPI001E575D51|nr:HD-GYP domain-containing protein [Ralstonia sp. UNC404CL21Col]
MTIVQSSIEPHRVPAGARPRRSKKVNTMAQQNRPHIMLASLTLAGASRYPSALGHLVRTAAVAAYLANVLELDDAEQERIYLVAPVHDIGKLGIPDDVLLKPASLTDVEHEIMQRHSNIGADLLAGTADPLLQMAASVARHHHEHFDGSGYPDGLAGKGVPLAARIVAVADAFDAMLEPRVYREGMPEDDALEALADQSGRSFDPALVDCFLKNVSGVRRIRAATEDLVQQYGDVSGVIRFYGVRGQSPGFFRHIQAL